MSTNTSTVYIVSYIAACMIASVYIVIHIARPHYIMTLESENTIQSILSNHSRSALLLRGEAMCNDGCDMYELRNGTFTLKIHDSLNLYDYRNGEGEEKSKVRGILFPKCLMTGLHKFGLNLDGGVFISRFETYQKQLFEEFCTVEKGPFNAILLEDVGRLKFIR